MSCFSAGTNSLILLKRYSSLSLGRPGGMICGGNSWGDGFQLLCSFFRTSRVVSLPSVSLLTTTFPDQTPGDGKTEGVPAEKGREVGAPVTLFHYGGPILQANQLCFIDGSRLLHHLDHVIKAPDGRSPELLLEKAERPVGCEFGMAHKHEADCVEASHDMPQEVLHNEPV